MNYQSVKGSNELSVGNSVLADWWSVGIYIYLCRWRISRYKSFGRSNRRSLKLYGPCQSPRERPGLLPLLYIYNCRTLSSKPPSSPPPSISQPPHDQSSCHHALRCSLASIPWASPAALAAGPFTAALAAGPFAAALSLVAAPSASSSQGSGGSPSPSSSQGSAPVQKYRPRPPR